LIGHLYAPPPSLPLHPPGLPSPTTGPRRCSPTSSMRVLSPHLPQHTCFPYPEKQNKRKQTPTPQKTNNSKSQATPTPSTVSAQPPTSPFHHHHHHLPPPEKDNSTITETTHARTAPHGGGGGLVTRTHARTHALRCSALRQDWRCTRRRGGGRMDGPWRGGLFFFPPLPLALPRITTTSHSACDFSRSLSAGGLSGCRCVHAVGLESLPCHPPLLVPGLNPGGK
jgi:hypothetical protein